MRTILKLFVVTLILNNVQELNAKYMYTSFNGKQFTISAPVELNVLVFLLFQLHTLG